MSMLYSLSWIGHFMAMIAILKSISWAVECDVDHAVVAWVCHVLGLVFHESFSQLLVGSPCHPTSNTIVYC